MNSEDGSNNSPNPVDGGQQEGLIALVDRAIEILRQEGEASQDFAFDVEWLKQRRFIWTSHAWRLALIGITSSGKSTFVNALMGADLLPTGVPPSSNTIICCRRGGSNEPFCRVRYRDKRSPEEFQGEAAIAEKLADLGDERRNPNNQLGIDEIELFSPALPFSDDVILIDTPGLDSYGLQSHEKLTLTLLLPTVDVVVFLQTVKSNASDQLHRILEIIHAEKKPLIFVQTQSDAVEAKPGLGRTIDKTKDQIKLEHREIARRLLAKAGFSVESTPVILVSAKLHLNGNKATSGMDNLVAAVKGRLSALGPELIRGRFQQLETELKRITDVNFSLAEIRDSRERVERQRREISGLVEKSDSLLTTLQRSLTLLIATTEKKLSESKNSAKSLGHGESDLHGARDIVEGFAGILREAVHSLSTVVHEAEQSVQELAKALNLSGEDVIFKERPSRRIPSIRIPKSVREVDDPGFLAWCARKFNMGGKHHEEHLDASEFRRRIKEHSEDHLKWMEDEAKPAIIANATERRRAITDEINRQLQMLDLEEKSQLTRETRLKVAKAMQALLLEMPDNNSNAQIPYHDGETEKEDAYQEIEVPPLTVALLRMAGRVSDHRLLCLRDKALNHVSKRAGVKASRRALVFGFDINSVERFLSLFWSDVPETRRRLLKNLTDLGATTSFDSIVVAQPNGAFRDSEQTIASYLSEPATLFLMVDLEQSGSAMNQIDRAHILEHLHPDVGLILVIQSIRGMFNAERLAEGIIYLHKIVQQFGLTVDAVLVNSDETFFTTALDALFERCGHHATLRDEQDFLASLCPRDANEERIAKQILRGWRDIQNIT